VTLKFGVIGCGLVGQKRARALGREQLVACVDSAPARARSLAAEFPGCAVTTHVDELLGRPDVDAVIVATPNNLLAPLTLSAIRARKHVLVEKPGAVRAQDLCELRADADTCGVVVKVGFNHRFHPAIARAQELFRGGQIGPLMHIRGRYGHGGRPGYEREWRADRAISGGGELLDQGIHLIDLARWFAGDFPEIAGHVTTSYWDMDVEDNAFVSLRTATNQTAWLHASCTEWKNLFSFEIFGRDGKLQMDGLGGSYGVERLTYYRMLPGMGPPETTIWEYPWEDRSWKLEIQQFVSSIETGKPLIGTLEDARAALEIVERIYGDAIQRQSQ
jgi:predicted dehydrogenase